MSATATTERAATVDAARSALQTSQQALAAAVAELTTATDEEAQAKERFTASEAQRLRSNGSGGGASGDLRLAYATARLTVESLVEVIARLRIDVAQTQQALQDAETQARQAEARAQWNQMVPEQIRAMSRMRKGFREVHASREKIVTLSHEMEQLAKVIGFQANATIFQERALQWSIDVRMGETFPALIGPTQHMRELWVRKAWKSCRPLLNSWQSQRREVKKHFNLDGFKLPVFCRTGAACVQGSQSASTPFSPSFALYYGWQKWQHVLTCSERSDTRQ